MCGFQSFALQLFSKDVLFFRHGNLFKFILTVDFDDSIHLDDQKTKFARTLTDALLLFVPRKSGAPNKQVGSSLARLGGTVLWFSFQIRLFFLRNSDA